ISSTSIVASTLPVLLRSRHFLTRSAAAITLGIIGISEWRLDAPSVGSLRGRRQRGNRVRVARQPDVAENSIALTTRRRAPRTSARKPKAPGAGESWQCSLRHAPLEWETFP